MTHGYRSMRRFAVPADDHPHTHTLTGDPLHVVADTIHPDHEPAVILGYVVEMYAEHHPGRPPTERMWQVFATGQALPDGAVWWGSAAPVRGRVWHLYEVTP